VRLNGTIAAVGDATEWGKTARMDVASLLHAGTNEVEARVSCAGAFPALSLELQADGLRLGSDETWESSLAGAVWQRARLASRPTEPAPGNWIYGAENIRGALRHAWPILAVFAGLSALAVAAMRRWGSLVSPKGWAVGFGIVFAAWAILILHNIPLLPAESGYDASAHLAYIQYIQEHKALPNASQGWEMFQAPLYYVLSAALLGFFHLKALQPAAAPVLCFFNLFLGAAELALILDALRLLFAGRRRCQMAGFLFAAFLPVLLYLTHYPTNELLGGVLDTAALWVGLRILRGKNARPGWYSVMGIVLGAALSSKASAVIVLAAVLLVLAAKARQEREAPILFIRNVAWLAGLCALFGGWHYARLWRDYGNPLTGNWNPAIGAAWWQQPGYRTPDYYWSFGRALVRPFFSGFHSFWDGVYSTWWGDGCFGGATRLYGRTPWNYNLMVLGYTLALAPTALALTGGYRALSAAIRRRQLDWLLLTAVALLFGAAIFEMSLKLPYYSESRALYGLPAALPFCAFGALGLEFWWDRFPKLQPAMAVCLGVWVLTVYASFWIRGNTVQTQLAVAIGLMSAGRQESRPALERVLELDPRNAVALETLAELDKEAGRPAQAVARLESSGLTQTNALLLTTLALYLGEQNQTAAAVDWARRATALAPDYAPAPALLCSLSLRAGLNEEAARAGRLALRVAPQDYEVQFDTGLALIRLRQFAEAAPYFSNALDCSPGGADAHFWLGIALWNLPGQKAEAFEQISSAVHLAPQNARWKATLDDLRKEMGGR